MTWEFSFPSLHILNTNLNNFFNTYQVKLVIQEIQKKLCSIWYQFEQCPTDVIYTTDTPQLSNITISLENLKIPTVLMWVHFGAPS